MLLLEYIPKIPVPAALLQSSGATSAKALAETAEIGHFYGEKIAFIMGQKAETYV
ncbi:hypothetical protein [Pontibacter beigongshangensis]|uniref:hypothetical protein n=1 Tax=Pontibacter beigongshangensis TaxID=2574733 RepID=UPI00164F60C5|nr:hypothetical protein [Pontibacter beigongshangensis]